MREIKFRVFDKKIGKIFKAHDLRFTAEEAVYEVCHDPIREDGGKHWTFTDFKEVVLMQFTGFKDFEGKEIYEGDVLEYVSFMLDENKRKEIVEFDEKCGGWYVHKQAETLSDVLFKQHNEDWQIKQNYKPSLKHKVRIIGNIYENL
jgi:uncharacterized phage protein (TIGR01671 family)